MTAAEFLDLCFSLLAQFNAFGAEQGFDADPEGVTFCKISLVTVSKDVVEVTMNATWADARTVTYNAIGDVHWQNKITHLLLVNPV